MMQKNTPKTNSERIAEMRKKRAEHGLVKIDIYADKRDHAAIKYFATQLQKKRMANDGL